MLLIFNEMFLVILGIILGIFQVLRIVFNYTGIFL